MGHGFVGVRMNVPATPAHAPAVIHETVARLGKQRGAPDISSTHDILREQVSSKANGIRLCRPFRAPVYIV